MVDRVGWELDDPDLFMKLYDAVHSEGKRVFLQHPATDSGVGPALELRDTYGVKTTVQTGIAVKVIALAYGGPDEKLVTQVSLPGYQYTTITDFITQCQIIAKSVKEKGMKDYILGEDYRMNKAGRIAFYLRSRD